MSGMYGMSYLIAAPEWLAAAATDLASVGSSISAANAAAAAPTTALVAAGADEVSAALAAAVRRARAGISGVERPGDDVSPAICADPHRGREFLRLG